MSFFSKIGTFLKNQQHVVSPVIAVFAIFGSFYGAQRGTQIGQENIQKSINQLGVTVMTDSDFSGKKTPLPDNPESKSLGAQDTAFNPDDWDTEVEDLIKQEGGYCSKGRDGFDISHIFLNGGLKIGEKAIMRIQLSKDRKFEESDEEPKLVVTYGDGYSMFFPGKDTSGIEFNAKGNTDFKPLRSHVDISKEILIEYYIKNILSSKNEVYFGYNLTFTPIDSETLETKDGFFITKLGIQPDKTLPAKKFGIGVYKGSCFDITSFSKSPLEER